MFSEDLDELIIQQSKLRFQPNKLREDRQNDSSKKKALQLHDVANQLQVVEIRISAHQSTKILPK